MSWFKRYQSEQRNKLKPITEIKMSNPLPFFLNFWIFFILQVEHTPCTYRTIHFHPHIVSFRILEKHANPTKNFERKSHLYLESFDGDKIKIDFLGWKRTFRIYFLFFYICFYLGFCSLKPFYQALKLLTPTTVSDDHKNC